VTPALAAAPQPSWRLIPSRFPPIAAFDTVATAADALAIMELEGWTNDRLVAERVARLPQSDWVFGRANASVVMASFLHPPPGGTRFSGAALGAWYASAAMRTAAAEVAHHLRREVVARRVAEMRRQYRAYSAALAGDYADLRGQQATQPDLYAPDNHVAGQAFGEALRASGDAGILYDSIRHRGGVNVVAYRPGNIGDVTQADHFEITVPAAGRIVVRRLGAAA
jgi:hypothetical protein